MKWKLATLVTFLAVAILAAVQASGRSQAQVSNPAATSYAYKVEPVRNSRDIKDLERRLNDNARNGWRVSHVVALSFNDELVVILEKPIGGP